MNLIPIIQPQEQESLQTLLSSHLNPVKPKHKKYESIERNSQAELVAYANLSLSVTPLSRIHHSQEQFKRIDVDSLKLQDSSLIKTTIEKYRLFWLTNARLRHHRKEQAINQTKVNNKPKLKVNVRHGRVPKIRSPRLSQVESALQPEQQTEFVKYYRQKYEQPSVDQVIVNKRNQIKLPPMKTSRQKLEPW